MDDIGNVFQYAADVRVCVTTYADLWHRDTGALGEIGDGEGLNGHVHGSGTDLDLLVHGRLEVALDMKVGGADVSNALNVCWSPPVSKESLWATGVNLICETLSCHR